MTVTRVAVFDPGLTTGLVTAEVWLARGRAESDVLNEIRATMELRHIKLPNEQYGTMKLWKALVDFEPDVIVGEDFRLFRVDSSDHVGIIADRILAMVDLLMHLTEMELIESSFAMPYAPTYLKQMPGERSIVTDEFLRRNDLWRTPKHIEGAVTGDSNHAMDALRHLIVYCRKAMR